MYVFPRLGDMGLWGVFLLNVLLPGFFQKPSAKRRAVRTAGCKYPCSRMEGKTAHLSPDVSLLSS